MAMQLRMKYLFFIMCKISIRNLNYTLKFEIILARLSSAHKGIVSFRNKLCFLRVQW